MSTPVLIALFVVCLAVSFLMSGMEAGVLALSRLRIRQLMRNGSSRARALHGYLEQPESFLWTILVGNTLANFTAVALLVWVLFGHFASQPLCFALCFVTAVFFFYALCELLPKMLFRAFPNRLCLLMVVPYRFVHLALAPLTGELRLLADGLLRWTGGRVFTGHLFANRDELRNVMQESAQGLTSEERVMINRVLDLQNLRLRQVTVPLDKAVTVGAQTLMAELLAILRDKKHTRLPVWREEAGRRKIIGVVSLKTLLFLAEHERRATAGEHIQPALFLDDEMRLEEALRRMQRSGQRLAIVLGRDRRELGIVSLADIMKVLFGEVHL